MHISCYSWFVFPWTTVDRQTNIPGGLKRLQENQEDLIQCGQSNSRCLEKGANLQP